MGHVLHRNIGIIKYAPLLRMSKERIAHILVSGCIHLYKYEYVCIRMFQNIKAWGLIRINEI